MGGRNDNWVEEELLLVCAVLYDSNWVVIPETDNRVKELSDLLRERASIRREIKPPTNFRSPSSVHLKMSNIVSCDPDYQGIRTHGGKLDKEVYDSFRENPSCERAKAHDIRKKD